jgi:hypothetical protein
VKCGGYKMNLKEKLLKEKLMEDHPQLSEMKIEQIIEESEEKVGREAENAKGDGENDKN